MFIQMDHIKFVDTLDDIVEIGPIKIMALLHMI